MWLHWRESSLDDATERAVVDACMTGSELPKHLISCLRFITLHLDGHEASCGIAVASASGFGVFVVSTNYEEPMGDDFWPGDPDTLHVRLHDLLAWLEPLVGEHWFG